MNIENPSTALFRMPSRTDDAPTRGPRGDECACATCCRIFKSEKGYKSHFIRNDRKEGRTIARCRTDAELMAKGLAFNPVKGHWREPNPVYAKPSPSLVLV